MPVIITAEKVGPKDPIKNNKGFSVILNSRIIARIAKDHVIIKDSMK